MHNDMFTHWDTFIKPALDSIDLNHIVEIGADTGLNTKNIILYCRQRNAKVTSIDPVASDEVLALRDEYKDCFTFIEKTSPEALSELSNYEAIIIDGDHNWYTVYNELKTIENTFNTPDDFPLIFFHDTAWPYARRDMYYSPERIPDEFRQPYSKNGIVPGQSELDEDRLWLNYFLYNATVEGCPKNGVLTAVEDFISESAHKFRLAAFNGHSGIGLLATHSLLFNHPKLKHYFDLADWAVPIGIAMEDQFKEIVELTAEYITLQRLKQKHADLKHYYNLLDERRIKLYHENLERQNIIDALTSSMSWKVTKPLRAAMNFLNRKN